MQGNQALANREYELAISFFDKAIALDDTFAMAYNNRGVAKLNNNRPAEAIQDYNEAIKIREGYFEAIGNRAYAYELIKRYQSSIDDWSFLIQTFPDSATLHNAIGLIHAKNRNFEEAVQSFGNALTLDKDNDETMVNQGIALFYLGRIPEAEESIKIAIDLNPKNAHAYNALSQLAANREEYQESLLWLEKTLALESDNPYFINNLGFTYLMLDSLEMGLSFVNQSILIEGDNPWAFRNKGIFYLKSGRPQVALKYFQQVLESKEFVDEIHGYTGLAHQERNDLAKACQAWTEGRRLKDQLADRLHKKYCF